MLQEVMKILKKLWNKVVIEDINLLREFLNEEHRPILTMAWF